MPWKVEMRNGRHAVVKKGSGQLVAMHQNAAQAQAHIKALYANVNKGPKYKKSRTYKTEMARSAVARRVANGKKPKIKEGIGSIGFSEGISKYRPPNLEKMPRINPYPNLEKMPRFRDDISRKPPRNLEKMPRFRDDMSGTKEPTHMRPLPIMRVGGEREPRRMKPMPPPVRKVPRAKPLGY